MKLKNGNPIKKFSQACIIIFGNSFLVRTRNLTFSRVLYAPEALKFHSYVTAMQCSAAKMDENHLNTAATQFKLHCTAVVFGQCTALVFGQRWFLLYRIAA